LKRRGSRIGERLKARISKSGSPGHFFKKTRLFFTETAGIEGKFENRAARGREAIRL